VASQAPEGSPLRGLLRLPESGQDHLDAPVAHRDYYTGMTVKCQAQSYSHACEVRHTATG